MQVEKIVVPEAKPAYEWVRGRPLQKMSPTRRHALLQRAFGTLLGEWAAGQGWVGSEWRFEVAPPGEASRPMVPDVAYIAAEKLSALPEADREYPPLAPDIVVEILSPGDRDADVDHKRAVYIAAGSSLVLIVDPLARTMQVHAPSVRSRVFVADETFISTEFPGLRIGLAALFAQLDSP